MLAGMTPKQKLELREAEIRTRLNELAGLEAADLTDELRTEIGALTTEYGDVGVRMQAAIVAEDDERRNVQIRTGDDDPETAELRDLQGRATLTGYLRHFADGEQLSGAERELAEHRGLATSGNVIPWDALLVPPRPGHGAAELRADVVTPAPASGNPVNQAAILQRVFARSAVRRLGVAMPSVGVGVASYPVITAGQSAAFVAADGAKEAAAGTVTPKTLQPKRLQARAVFRIEDAMITAGLESALREDLSLSIGDALDAQLIGAGSADVRGFLATAANGGIADYADPSDLVTFAAAAEQAARGVDGKYAGSESECTWVIGTETYQKLAALIQANDSTSATERLRRLLRDFMASANVPAATNAKIQQGIIGKMGAPDGGMNAVCPLWEGLRLIRDEVTKAAEGQIAVTAVALHNFAILRADAFVRTKLKLAA